MRSVELPSGEGIFVVTGRNGSGKTRLLQRFATGRLEFPRRNSRLICLSGTVLDKFPFVNAPDDEHYVYLGRRTNNNMFSEIAPYRALVKYFSMASHGDTIRRAHVARDLLKAIGLGGGIQLRFRRARDSKDKLKLPSRDLDLAFLLDEPSAASSRLQERLNQLKEGWIHLSAVSFTKDDQVLDLMDLSSGERSYALTMLALAFCVNDGATVLFDEPENSLHPAWQSSIMKDMWRVIREISSGSQLVVATHSPLIVSGASNAHAYVWNMESPSGWMPSSLYGNSADVVLKQQFGLASARSMSFLTLVRECLQALVTVETDPATFKEAADRLRRENVQLDRDDPLYATVQAIVERRELIQ